MNFAAAWKARVAGEQRHEIENTLLRVVIAAIVLGYLAWHYSHRYPTWTDDNKRVFLGVAAWLVAAVGMFALTWAWPRPHTARRVLVIVLDIGVLTAVLWRVGMPGAVLASMYLFFVFSNGFRFGRGYLYLTQALSLLSLLALALYAPWWQARPEFSISWLVATFVLPLYVSALISRLRSSRAGAAQGVNA